MEVREIKIFSTVGTKVTLNTNATTFGEIKTQLASNDIDYNNLQLVVGETKATLDLDEAVLPEGPFKIYLMPKQTKSGSKDLAELFRDLSETCELIADEFACVPSNKMEVESAEVDHEALQAVKEMRGLGL